MSMGSMGFAICGVTSPARARQRHLALLESTRRQSRTRPPGNRTGATGVTPLVRPYKSLGTSARWWRPRLPQRSPATTWRRTGALARRQCPSPTASLVVLLHFDRQGHAAAEVDGGL